MARGRMPPMPQPAQPSQASGDANYLSAQIQQMLAAVLPEPVVKVLASISDMLYRFILGRTNIPPTYTSTLLPPVLLVLVTFFSFLVVYRSIKSMFSFVISSIKLVAILGIIGFAVAYHLGNGNVQQGAHAAAQNTEGWSQQIGDAVKRYPGAQQLAPFASYMPRQLGMVTGALPALQGASGWLVGSFGAQNDNERASRGQEYEMTNPPPRADSNARFRGYRDVRPPRRDAHFDGSRRPSGDENRANTGAGAPFGWGFGRS